MTRVCLFCSGRDPDSTEHIIPESLGNDDLLLINELCTPCNNYFSKIENYVIQKTEIAFWRAFLGIRTKKSAWTSVDLSQPRENKGIYPDTHPMHDNNVGFCFHDDGTCSVDIYEDSIVRDILLEKRNRFNVVMTPKVLEQLSRFFCKVGIELICIIDPTLARSDVFRRAREYARLGSMNDLWPIFYYSSGNIGDLRRHCEDGHEEVDCYEYSLFEIGAEYTLLRLNIGTSNWVVCLNNQWPSPEIRKAFPETDLQLIWYPRESYRDHSVR